MQRSITISDSDRAVDYTLDVSFDACPEEKETPRSMAGPGEPGYPAHLESVSCRCTEIMTWCGARGEYGVAGAVSESLAQRAIGDAVYAEHREEIEELIWQGLSDDFEQGKADIAEAAQEVREEHRRLDRDEGRAA